MELNFKKAKDLLENTYLIIYSPNPDDQMRFDNYDNVWPVKTRPHHLHIRGMQNVVESPMTGAPDNDIPIIFKYI